MACLATKMPLQGRNGYKVMKKDEISIGIIQKDRIGRLMSADSMSFFSSL
jgi:hypothetical protein